MYVRFTLSSLLLVLIFSCTYKDPRPTEVFGYVYDLKTLESIPEARIDFYIASDHPHDHGTIKSVKSDSTGRYYFIDGTGRDIWSSRVDKEGYLTSFVPFPIVKHEISDIDIDMVQLDGTIEFEFYHTNSTTPDSLLVYLENESYQRYSPSQSEFLLTKNDLVIELNDSLSIHRRIPAEEWTWFKIYNYKAPLQNPPGPIIVDSLFVTKGDTTSIIINF